MPCFRRDRPHTTHVLGGGPTPVKMPREQATGANTGRSQRRACPNPPSRFAVRQLSAQKISTPSCRRPSAIGRHRRPAPETPSPVRTTSADMPGVDRHLPAIRVQKPKRHSARWRQEPVPSRIHPCGSSARGSDGVTGSESRSGSSRPRKHVTPTPQQRLEKASR